MSDYRVRYQTLEFGKDDIHLRTLRNRQEFSDDQQIAERLGISSAAWPIFGVVWQSGEILARLMHTRNIDNLRILEVGCGIGLTSLVLQQRGADITATDHHPEANAFLDANTNLNDLQKIPFERIGWADLQNNLGEFDLILGSDLLYEAEHIELLSQFIHRHMAADGELILVDPGRGHRAKFQRAMLTLGYQESGLSLPDEHQEFKGKISRYFR